ncbi:hypothetical protein, partial [Ruegeria sp.]|uniref:hypothetical protein n=1 Tax=Ruegeria sp. TaxID=1879320 RepID=UPI002317E2D9
MNQEQVEHICAALTQARAAGEPAGLAAGDIPDAISDAYVISLTQMQSVAAWKIGGANPWSKQVFNNADSFFGPLHPNELFLDDPVVS